MGRMTVNTVTGYTFQSRASIWSGLCRAHARDRWLLFDPNSIAGRPAPCTLASRVLWESVRGARSRRFPRTLLCFLRTRTVAVNGYLPGETRQTLQETQGWSVHQTSERAITASRTRLSWSGYRIYHCNPLAVNHIEHKTGTEWRAWFFRLRRHKFLTGRRRP